MKLKQIATALTIGAFSVVSLTGLLLFTDSNLGGIRAAHEWIGIAFVAAGLIHLLSHKKAFLRYLQTKYLLPITAMILAGGVICFASQNDIYASAAAFELLTNTEMNTLAAVLELEPDVIADRLRAMGLTTEPDTVSMVNIAKSNQIDIHEIMDILLQESMK